MLFGDRVIHTTYAALRERPKAFNGISVNISAYIDLLGVIDPMVIVSRFLEVPIRFQFIGVDRGRWQHALNDVWHERVSRYILNGQGDYFSAALYHPQDRSLVGVPATDGH